MFDADVLVIGGGPVGEMLLLLLAKRGIRAIGLEKDDAVWPQPRAVHFDGETLRTFQSLGLGDEVEALCEPMLNYRMENEAGEVLLDIPTGALGSQGWLDDYMFNQPEIDRLLRDRIEATSTVRLVTGATALETTQDADGVECRVRLADGTEQSLRARYLVGCDGASSLVRRSIGSKYENLGSNDPWLIVDADIDEQPPIEGSMVFLGHYSRPKIWAAMPGNRGRMEFKILPGDDLETITSAESVERLSGGMLRPDNFRIERSAVYTFRSCVATSWRSGRVFIAGDAAHLAPPLFGQGLCAGIRDAANLSWKLGLVLGGAPESLLDTYESERQPHAIGWVKQSTTMAGTIQTTDAGVAAGRDAFVRAHPEASMPHPPLLGKGLHRDDDETAGHLSLQPQLPGGQRFDDVAGDRFVVAATRDRLEALPHDLIAALRDDPLHICLVTPEDAGVSELLDSHSAEAVVVRPDRYLLGCAGTPDEFAALVRRVVRVLSGTAREAA